MNVLKTISKSFLASLCICIGCVVNLFCISKGNPFVGAVLFSLGLLTVCRNGYNLYTGKIGFVVKNKNYIEVIVILISNLVFSYFLGILTRSIIPLETVLALCNSKLEASFLEELIKSVFCGILMYIAVDSYLKNKSSLMIIFSVAAFILSGFEHSIANTIYFGMSGLFNLKVVLVILVNVLGNTIGSLLVYSSANLL